MINNVVCIFLRVLRIKRDVRQIGNEKTIRSIRQQEESSQMTLAADRLANEQKHIRLEAEVYKC